MSLFIYPNLSPKPYAVICFFSVELRMWTFKEYQLFIVTISIKLEIKLYFQVFWNNMTVLYDKHIEM